ncbi:MAG: glycosyltransferase family 39 protein [Clostridia bacterium]|nr:glycosyltransferase family 39 protein [Clostridia bacterium]
MKLRKNAFFYFAVLVFLLCMLFSMACVFNRLGAGQEYPYLLKGAWILGALALTLALLGACALWARLDVSQKLRRYPGPALAAEYLLAALLLLAGAFLRYQVIRSLPMEPDSDYKTYYEMAVLLHRGTLVEAGVGYCDYVSMFPHVFGYPWVLAWMLGVFGESVHTALMFNLVLEVGVCLVAWRIARLLGGRLCGLVSLAAVCFLPSNILYSNLVASEPLFTLVLLLGAWLFALSLKDSERQKRHPWLCAGELTAMAAVLAFGSFIRPMAVIFLIAAVICLLPTRKELPSLPRNDIPLGLRLTNRGVKRCALVCAVYFGLSGIFTMATGYAVNRQLAGSASYGYNLLVGLNLQSYGGWNEDDANYLYAALEATGSAQEAQLMCRDMALERLKVDPRALLDLFVHKFEVLWGNDDFGASWNILFLDQQGTLTPERESFLYRMMDVSDLYYLVLLFAAGVYGCLCLRRGPDAMYACLLLFCGTAGLHLFVENQNRYHYHALALLCMMSGMSVREVMALVRQSVMDRLERKRREAAEMAARASRVLMLQQEEADRARLRAEALHAQFDMGAAIREGHIRIVASEGVAMSDPAPLKVPADPPQPPPVPGAVPEQPAPGSEENIPAEETPAPAKKAHGKKGKKR